MRKWPTRKGSIWYGWSNFWRAEIISFFDSELGDDSKAMRRVRRSNRIKGSSLERTILFVTAISSAVSAIAAAASAVYSARQAQISLENITSQNRNDAFQKYIRSSREFCNNFLLQEFSVYISITNLTQDGRLGEIYQSGPSVVEYQSNERSLAEVQNKIGALELSFKEFDNAWGDLSLWIAADRGQVAQDLAERFSSDALSVINARYFSQMGDDARIQNDLNYTLARVAFDCIFIPEMLVRWNRGEEIADEYGRLVAAKFQVDNK